MTDATPETSCLYCVPARDDPAYMKSDGDNAPTANACPDNGSFGNIRALPTRAGGLVTFTHRLLHWGSRADARACARKGSMPRMAIAFGASDPNEYPPFFSASHGPIPKVTLRAALVAGQALVYGSRATMTEERIGLYWDVYRARASEFAPHYRKSVASYRALCRFNAHKSKTETKVEASGGEAQVADGNVNEASRLDSTVNEAASWEVLEAAVAWDEAGGAAAGDAAADTTEVAEAAEAAEVAETAEAEAAAAEAEAAEAEAAAEDAANEVRRRHHALFAAPVPAGDGLQFGLKFAAGAEPTSPTSPTLGVTSRAWIASHTEGSWRGPGGRVPVRCERAANVAEIESDLASSEVEARRRELDVRQVDLKTQMELAQRRMRDSLAALQAELQNP